MHFITLLHALKQQVLVPIFDTRGCYTVKKAHSEAGSYCTVTNTGESSSAFEHQITMLEITLKSRTIFIHHN